MNTQRKNEAHPGLSVMRLKQWANSSVKMRARADVDPLTGLGNHRFMQERLGLEIQHAERCGSHFSLMMVDIYNFKLFNETYGYQRGDELIEMVAKLLTSSSRQADVVGRYGGDEFILLLPGTNAERAMVLGNKIIAAAAQDKFLIPPKKLIPISLSIGIAMFPDDSNIRHELVNFTEQAMNEAKQKGANAVQTAKTELCRVYAYQNREFSVLDSLVVAVDTKDHYTKLHSESVAYWSLELAQRLNLSKADKKSLYFAGLLHDIGKIGIPESILRKPGALTDEELNVIKQHPVLGKMIIQQVPQFKDILDIVLHHHERFDGKGYPDGLKGKQIPFLARLVGAVDAFVAMTVDRPYHKAFPVEEAINRLEQSSGTQFDPQLTQSFIKVLRDIAPKGKILTCWEYKKCDKDKCPLYNNKKLGHLCWVIREILYKDQDKLFANKGCKKCCFYKKLQEKVIPLRAIN